MKSISYHPMVEEYKEPGAPMTSDCQDALPLDFSIRKKLTILFKPLVLWALII
jgi:hypothetical protein